MVGKVRNPLDFVKSFLIKFGGQYLLYDLGCLDGKPLPYSNFSPLSTKIGSLAVKT